MTAFPSRAIARLSGHQGAVHAVAYSHGSSQYIMTGGADRTIRLYNPDHAPISASDTPPKPSHPPPGLLQKYSAHGYEVLSIDISVSNDRFVSSGGDKTVFFWDVPTAQTTRRWTGHSGRINAVAFAGHDESVVVSGSYDGTVKIWDARSRDYKPLTTFDQAKDSVSDVRIFDTEIITGSVDGRIRSYDLRMGQCTVDVIGHPVTSLDVTKKASEVLVSSLDSTIRLLDRENGELLKTYKDENFVNKDLRVRSTLGMNDNVVLSGSDDGMVYAWDLEGNLLHKFKHDEMSEIKGWKPPSAGKRSFVSAVAFCKARNEWVSAGGDGNVIVWGEA